MKNLFIYNPSSGKGKVKKNIGLIEEKLNNKFGKTEIIESKSKEHLIEVVRNACLNHYDYVFFSGGDGTFNIVINSIPEIDNLPVFGYLPGGSTCDMSYNLNISKKIKYGLDDLCNATVKEHDVGIIGDKKFIYVSDFGALTSVSHITPAEKKRKYGGLAYIYYGSKVLFKSFGYQKITIDGIIYETPLFILSNSKEIASFKLDRNKQLNDGIYKIIIVKPGIFNGLFNIINLFFNGLENAIQSNSVICLTGSTFIIDCSYNDFDVDGEAANINFPCVCGYSGRKIKILTNR